MVEVQTALIFFFSGFFAAFIALSAGFFYGKPWLDRRQQRIDSREKLEIAAQKKASGA